MLKTLFLGLFLSIPGNSCCLTALYPMEQGLLNALFMSLSLSPLCVCFKDVFILFIIYMCVM